MSSWRRLLSLFSNNHNKLHKSLRLWTSSGQHLCRSWPFLYSPSLHILYRHYPNSFEACVKLCPNIFDFTPLETTHHLPNNSISVDAKVTPPAGSLPILPWSQTILMKRSHFTWNLTTMSTLSQTTMQCSSNESTFTPDPHINYTRLSSTPILSSWSAMAAQTTILDRLAG
jgi:hypothetical protein